MFGLTSKICGQKNPNTSIQKGKPSNVNSSVCLKRPCHPSTSIILLLSKNWKQDPGYVDLNFESTSESSINPTFNFSSLLTRAHYHCSLFKLFWNPHPHIQTLQQLVTCEQRLQYLECFSVYTLASAQNCI